MGKTEKSEHFTFCTLCPRQCGANRQNGANGLCGASDTMLIARAGRHDWEEPCISGERGSGAIFFSGCPLGCVFCQNYGISRELRGREVTVERLREIISELEESGVHNINLVTAGHFAPLVAEALTPKPKIPVVWNSSGYESVETLRLLQGRIQIYLPDLKYSDSGLAMRYSNAPDYFEKATAAILEMYRQTGPYVLDESGIMKSGVIIRHLALPGALRNSAGVLKWVAENFTRGEVLFSLMSQYLPCGEASRFPEINRRITKGEYAAIKRLLIKLNITEGYVQDMASAEDSYIPDFNFEGL